MPDFVVDVLAWSPDEEHPIYPEGSRDKELLRCPDPAPHQPLIANHRYQFKQSRNSYPAQFWAEVVAYRIGRLARVPVPPTYPACRSSTGVCGALIEWFYGYPGRPVERYISGGPLMKALIPDYDMARGRQHNFESIEQTCLVWADQTETSPVQLERGWLRVWARMLAFDALIGNTDRHHSNWGLLIDPAIQRTGPNVRIAPAFDNGTSLGSERPEDQFARFNDPNYLERYIHNGYHHMKWRRNDAQQAQHGELLLKLAAAHPDMRLEMIDVLTFDGLALGREVVNLTTLELPVPLSPARAGFMLLLTLARRDRLMRALTA